MGRHRDYDLDDDDPVPGRVKGKGKKSSARKPSVSPERSANRSPQPKATGGRSPQPGRNTTPQPKRAPAQTPPPASSVREKKEALNTSENVYHRILWDKRLDPSDFTLGYEDRFKGILFMPITKFRNTGDETSEIPFHRVYFFKYKGRIVWDRNQRVDLMDALYESDGTTVVASLLANLRDATNLRIVAKEEKPGSSSSPLTSSKKPTSESGASSSEAVVEVVKGDESECGTPSVEVTPPAADAVKEMQRVRLATFNVLFDLFDKELIHTAQRIPLICSELEKVDADILCLQELTSTLYEGIRMHSKVLRERYNWTTLPKDTKSAQAVLSKYPISDAASQAMSKHKRCIYAVTHINLQPVVVANCHLISDYAGDSSVDRRVNEIKIILESLLPHTHAIMAGDFNFGDESPEHTRANFFDFVDCHLATSKNSRDDPGYTFDITKNWLAEISCKHHRYPRRLDRILCRGFQPQSSRVFASQSTSVTVKKGAVDLFPSDHFGVAAETIMSEPPAAHVDPAAGLLSVTSTAPGKGSADNFFPVYKTALVIIPPRSVCDAADTYRVDKDKAFPRWMPHITLLFPFVHTSKFSAAIEVIDQALNTSTIQPFNVKLRRPNYFTGRKSVVHIVPETVEREIIGLHALLQPLFPACGRPSDPDLKTEDGGFNPHLTLGQVDRKEVITYMDHVKATWVPTEFTVTQIHMIAHLEDRPSYEIMHSFDLKAASMGGMGGPSPSMETPGHFAISDMVMEDPKWGNRKLEPYVPKDPLEAWMAKVTQTKYAREVPTHISQLGAMYHIPSNLLDEYLSRWAESFELREEVPFYIEEIRGDPFRLYVDIDIKRTIEVPYDASELIACICGFTKKMFPMAEVSCMSVECHGEWKETRDEAVVYKSGFRIYFQRVFVQRELYVRYIRRLIHYCRSNFEKEIPFLPENTTWDDIIDEQCADWERGRLFGTIKRRKHIHRIYSFHGIYNEEGRLEKPTETFKADVRTVLYGQTLRLWDVLPSAPGVLQDNHFMVERLYSQLEGIRQTDGCTPPPAAAKS